MPKKLNAYLLIDRSGSMASNWDETIGALNGYAESLTNDKATKDASITVACFDKSNSKDDFVVVRDSVPVAKFKPILKEEVYPRGSTPLFDAIGKMKTIIDKGAKKLVALTIMTDGYENASVEVDKLAAGAMIADLKAKGFDVTFIGADFDAIGQAASVGVGMGATINTTAGNYRATMQVMAGKAASYAASGEVRNFTEEDRKAATGKK